MSKIKHAKITKSAVEKLGADETIRDTELIGFGVRRQSGVPRYFVQKKIYGRARWMTIGPHGSPWTAETARRQATQLIGNVAGGHDPQAKRLSQRAIPTVREAGPIFLAEHGPKMKASSRRKFERLLEMYVYPKLGKLPLNLVTRAEVTKTHADLAHIPQQANYVLVVISSLMAWAEDAKFRDDGTNPARRIKLFPRPKRERYLTQEEFSRIGAVLNHVNQRRMASVYTVAAIRLLLFTGARVGEILTLKWEYVDFERRQLRLPDSKTGPKVIHLNKAAVDVLKSTPRLNNSPYVIIGLHPPKHMVDLKANWSRIRDMAGIPDVRLHDLRHSFASVAAGKRGSLPMIGKLLGHSESQSTARYAHLTEDPVRQLNDEVGAAISELLGPLEPVS